MAMNGAAGHAHVAAVSVSVVTPAVACVDVAAAACVARSVRASVRGAPDRCRRESPTAGCARSGAAGRARRGPPRADIPVDPRRPPAAHRCSESSAIRAFRHEISRLTTRFRGLAGMSESLQWPQLLDPPRDAPESRGPGSGGRRVAGCYARRRQRESLRRSKCFHPEPSELRSSRSCSRRYPPGQTHCSFRSSA